MLVGLDIVRCCCFVFVVFCCCLFFACCVFLHLLFFLHFLELTMRFYQFNVICAIQIMSATRAGTCTSESDNISMRGRRPKGRERGKTSA